MDKEDILTICQACRRCCIASEIRVRDADIEKWKKHGRLDILLSMNPHLGGSRQLIKKDDSDECIFLSANGSCEINEDKPEICREYPNSKAMAEKFGCKLIGKVNLT